jgi:hypothetical protein
MKKNPFPNLYKYKIAHLVRDIATHKDEIDFLKLSQVHKTNVNNFESFISNTLTHYPKLYDLYNFQGVTYSTDPPTPSANYTHTEDGYYFKLPVWGYRVEHGDDPVTISGGSTPWEFLATVSIIHTKYSYVNLPESFLKKAKILTYLYNNSNAPMPSFETIVTPYEFNLTSTDFGWFYRWLKVDNGYVLDYYAFFLYSEEVDVKVQTNVYFLDKDLANESKPSIIQNS